MYEDMIIFYHAAPERVILIIALARTAGPFFFQTNLEAEMLFSGSPRTLGLWQP